MNIEKISEYLSVSEETLDSLHILNYFTCIDSPLYVNYLLINGDIVPEFRDSVQSIQDRFVQVITKVKQAKGLKDGVVKRRILRQARKLLTLKEPKGINLGVGIFSEDGNGFSGKLTKFTLEFLSMVLDYSEDPDLMFSLPVFGEGFGPDMMSDLICGIIYKDFLKYTERCCVDMKVDMSLLYTYTYENIGYNIPWRENSDGNQFPLLFVPKNFVSEIPMMLRRSNFMDDLYEYEYAKDSLNEEFSQLLAKHSTNKLTGAEILKYIIENDLFDEVANAVESIDESLYNVDIDDKRVLKWYEDISNVINEVGYSTMFTLSKITSQEELIYFIDETLENYQKLIKDNGLNKSLHINNELAGEKVFQLMYFIATKFVCSLVGVEIILEGGFGKGNVDFIFTAESSKTLVEFKLMGNPNYIAGYNKQIESYIAQSSTINDGFYVVFRNTEIKTYIKSTETFEKGIDKKDYIYIRYIDVNKYVTPSKMK